MVGSEFELANGGIEQNPNKKRYILYLHFVVLSEAVDFDKFALLREFYI